MHLYTYTVNKQIHIFNLLAASRSPLVDTLVCCWIFACCEIGWTLELLGGSPSGNAGMWGRGLLCNKASVKKEK